MHIGGLDHEEGQDGKYTYIWHDEVIQSKFSFIYRHQKTLSFMNTVFLHLVVFL